MELQLLSNVQGYVSGSIDGNRYSLNYMNTNNDESTKRISFTNTDESILKAFDKCCERLGVKLSWVGQLLPSGKEIFNLSVSNKEGLSILYSHLGLCIHYKADTLERSVKDSFIEGDLPIKLYDRESLEFRRGWLAAMLDNRGSIIKPPKYRLSIINTDREVIEYACESLDTLGINYVLYWYLRATGKDVKPKKEVGTIILNRAASLKLFRELIPIQCISKIERLDEIVEWTLRQTTKYSTDQLVELHINQGLSLSDMCRSLGESTNSAGRLANQMRKAGVDVRSQMDGSKTINQLDAFDRSYLYKLYEEHGRNATAAINFLGIEVSGNKLLNLLEDAGYTVDRGPSYKQRAGDLTDLSLLPSIYERLCSGESASFIIKSLGIGCGTASSKLLTQLENHGYDVSLYRRKILNKHSYTLEDLVELHINQGLSLNSMCRSLGLPDTASGILAKKLRDAGYTVKSRKSKSP